MLGQKIIEKWWNKNTPGIVDFIRAGTSSGIELQNSSSDVLVTISDDVEINGVMVAKENVYLEGLISLGDPGNSRIASGNFTITEGYNPIGTEGGAGTDDLFYVKGCDTRGQIVVFTGFENNDVVFKDGSGNLRLAGSADFTLTGEDTITLVCYSTSSFGFWREVSRSDN